jgi:biopolymer transport protein ExbB
MSIFMSVLAQESAGTGTRSLLEYIKSGGFLGAILIGLSVVALALTILHFVQVRMSRLAPPFAVDSLEKYFREHNIDEAIRFCRAEEHDSFITRVVGSALTRVSRSTFGMLELRTALEEAGGKELDKLHRTTDGVGLIAAIGPMLGLLGTVFGMIGAFGSIGELEGAARSKALAGFMALALVNTAEGLAVAIPCTVLFAIFKRRIDGLVADVAEIIDDLAGLLEQRGEAPKAAPGARPMARPAPVPPPTTQRAAGVVTGGQG